MLPVQAPALQRCRYGRYGGAGVGGHQHQVGASLQGEHRSLAGAVAAGDGVHHQGIGNDQAFEAQLPAQQAREHRLGQGGWPLAIKGGQHQVGCHHRGHPCGDRLLKGGQFDRRQPLPAVGQQGQGEVRIAAGVPVAGEVLGAAQHPFCLHALQEGRRQGACRSRILSPGPHVDHRVGGVVVDVTHRPQHPVEPQGPGLPAGAAAVALGQGQGPLGLPPVQPAQGQGRHQPGGSVKALTHPLLHVGAEQQGLAGPAAELGAAQGQLGRTAPQQDHAAHAGFEQAAQFGIGQLPAGIAALVIRQFAAGAHHQQLVDQPQQGPIGPGAGVGPGLRTHWLRLVRPWFAAPPRAG